MRYIALSLIVLFSFASNAFGARGIATWHEQQVPSAAYFSIEINSGFSAVVDDETRTRLACPSAVMSWDRGASATIELYAVTIPKMLTSAPEATLLHTFTTTTVRQSISTAQGYYKIKVTALEAPGTPSFLSVHCSNTQVTINAPDNEPVDRDGDGTDDYIAINTLYNTGNHDTLDIQAAVDAMVDVSGLEDMPNVVFVRRGDWVHNSTGQSVKTGGQWGFFVELKDFQYIGCELGTVFRGPTWDDASGFDSNHYYMGHDASNEVEGVGVIGPCLFRGGMPPTYNLFTDESNVIRGGFRVIGCKNCVIDGPTFTDQAAQAIFMGNPSGGHIDNITTRNTGGFGDVALPHDGEVHQAALKIQVSTSTGGTGFEVRNALFEQGGIGFSIDKFSAVNARLPNLTVENMWIGGMNGQCTIIGDTAQATLRNVTCFNAVLFEIPDSTTFLGTQPEFSNIDLTIQNLTLNNTRMVIGQYHRRSNIQFTLNETPTGEAGLEIKQPHIGLVVDAVIRNASEHGILFSGVKDLDEPAYGIDLKATVQDCGFDGDGFNGLRVGATAGIWGGYFDIKVRGCSGEGIRQMNGSHVGGGVWHVDLNGTKWGKREGYYDIDGTPNPLPTDCDSNTNREWLIVNDAANDTDSEGGTGGGSIFNKLICNGGTENWDDWTHDGWSGWLMDYYTTIRLNNDLTIKGSIADYDDGHDGVSNNGCIDWEDNTGVYEGLNVPYLSCSSRADTGSVARYPLDSGWINDNAIDTTATTGSASIGSVICRPQGMATACISLTAGGTHAGRD